MDISIEQMLSDAELGAMQMVSHFAKQALRCQREGNDPCRELYQKSCKEAEDRVSIYQKQLEALKAS